LILLDRLATDTRVTAGAETAGQLATDLEGLVGVGFTQGLDVGVDGQEFYPAQSRFDHAVDGVSASTADPDHLDISEISIFLDEIKPHDWFPLILEMGKRHPCVTNDTFLTHQSTAVQSNFPIPEHFT
jgi:hypothetical protein